MNRDTDSGSESNPFSIEGRDSVAPEVNPYAPTTNVSPTEGLESDVESFRRAYLNHEASVKSVGTLYLFGGVMMTVLFLFMFVVAVAGLLFGRSNATPSEDAGFFLIIASVYGLLGGLQLYGGWGVRQFKKGPRTIVTILSALGLFAFPFGTLINGYFLYLLHGNKGKVVFSEAYQEAIRRTPHIKYKTPLIVKILVGALILLIAFGLLAAFFAG